MGNVGKPPHRPDGKKGADRWDQRQSVQGTEPASTEEEYQRNLRELEARKRETTGVQGPGAEQGLVGGSRPGVESRVKEANAEREERERRESND